MVIGNDTGGTIRTMELERSVLEKNVKIEELEKLIVESEDRTNSMQKDIVRLEKELRVYEAEDIGVLKVEIRVRDERILQLEEEIDSLERAFNEGVDLEQIEELMNVISKKQDRERQFEKDIESKRDRIEELSVALRESVVIATDGERRYQREEKLKNNALERVRVTDFLSNYKYPYGLLISIKYQLNPFLDAIALILHGLEHYLRAEFVV